MTLILHISLNIFSPFRLKVEVLVNDHIVLKGEKTGHVRYLGHLDGVGQPQVVFAGVALDAPGKC